MTNEWINEWINDALNWFIPNFYTKLESLILLSILVFAIRICCLKGRSETNLDKSILESIYLPIAFIICMIYLPVLLVITFSLPCLFIPLVELMTKYPLFHSVVSFVFCHVFLWAVLIKFECILSLIYSEFDSFSFTDLELFWFVTAFFATLCVV